MVFNCMKSFINCFLLPVFLFVSFNADTLESSEVISYGQLYSAKMKIMTPRSIQDVQTIVKEAKKEGLSVCTMGAGMSQGKQYLCSRSILIDMRLLNAMKIEEKVLTVEAGTLWKNVQDCINTHGLALQVMQGSNIFSVGGSLSVNCHGWDFKKGSIINTIEKISIIDANGDLIELKPQDSLFHYVIGGYGCFGIIVEAKIQLTDNCLIREISEEVDVKDYVDYFHNQVINNHEIVMHRYRLSIDPKEFFQYGIATNYEKIGDTAEISDLSPDKTSESFVKAGMWLAKNIPSLKSFLWKLAKAELLKEKISSRNKSMSPPAEFHFIKQKNSADWLQEFFIEKDNLVSFLEYLKDVIQKNDVNLLSTTVRYVKGQPNIGLAYSPDKDRFAVVLFFQQSLNPSEIEKTQMWVREVIDYVIEHDGKYYLPYQHFATLEQFQKCYPNETLFKMMKIQQDPNCVFSNGFYEEYVK